MTTSGITYNQRSHTLLRSAVNASRTDLRPASRMIAGIVFTAAIVISAASCGIWKSPASGPGSSHPRSIQIISSDGWIYDVMGENARRFEQETGIKLSFTIYASHVYYRALQTILASGEAIDIFLMQSTKWYLGSELDPVSSCIDLTNEEWTKRLKPEWLPAVSYKDRVYGLIIWDDTVGWVYTYNDRIFKRLGLQAPRTTREFMDLCEKIKQAGIDPIYEPGASRWHSALTFFEMGGTFEKNDPGLYDRLNENTETFAGYEPFHRALDQIVTAASRGYLGRDFMANTIEGAKTALISETAAMTLNKIGFSRSVFRDNPESGARSWGMFPIPWLDNTIVSIERSAPTWFGNAKSRDPAAVLEFFRFLTREDNLYRYAMEQPEGTSLSFPTPPVPLLPNEEAFFGSTRFGGEPFQGGVKYIMGQWMELEADFGRMLVGAMTPRDFLAGVDARRANMAISGRDPAWKDFTDGVSNP